jgi:uncharacterized protein (TIGR02246 family)
VGVEDPLRRLHRGLIDGWNSGDAGEMTAALADDGLVIGFDGSQMLGRDQAAAELGRIFADHETARYVAKVRAVRALGDAAGVLHAVAGMVPPSGAEIVPERNAIQTVVAHRAGDGWEIVLFQTTPARFDGRPELTERLTAELSELLGG